MPLEKSAIFQEMEKKIKWRAVEIATRDGKLVKLLQSPEYPPSTWEEKDIYGWSFVHYACANFGQNDDALVMLIKNGCDLEKCSKTGKPPIFFATKISTLNILCVAGANLQPRVENEKSILYSLIYRVNRMENRIEYINCAKLILSNGVRLNTVEQDIDIPESLVLFEQGVLRCRDAIVILLGLKKRKQILGKLDRFLLQEILAVEIWSTRMHVDTKHGE